MKIVSWNVNGINSCLRDGLLDFIKKDKADVYCFQEVKVSPEKIDKKLLDLKGYESYFLFAEKKGYSGLLVYSKKKPLSIIKGISRKEIDKEGRVLALEFDKFFIINAYFPHTGRELERMEFKIKFNKLFLDFCNKLKKKKPIIIAADFNVAHTEIDLANPKQNKKNAGFTIEERNWFDKYLNSDLIDSLRLFNKDGGHYTWWTYRNNARKRNIGWRIDYFLVDKRLKNKIKSSKILKDIIGSDHCPISLDIDC